MSGTGVAVFKNFGIPAWKPLGIDSLLISKTGKSSSGVS